MKITNPFANFSNNISKSNDNDNSNYNQNNHPTHLPPTKNEIQNKKSTYKNEDNSFTSPPPKSSSFSQSTPFNPPQSQNNINQNAYNNNYNDQSIDEEFNQIKNEFESKIKPLNCSSEYISTTSNILPSNEETLSKLSIPISISLCPMKNTGIELPLINYGDKSIPRCPNANCRAYLNPFVKFIDGGEKWI